MTTRWRWTVSAVALRQPHRHGVLLRRRRVNRRIPDALSWYDDDLVIVSKVGARSATSDRPAGVRPSIRPDLRAAVELDLAGLGWNRSPW